MNYSQCLSGLSLEEWSDAARKDAGLKTKAEAKSSNTGNIIASGVTSVGNVLTSFFGYKTAQLSQTDPNRTAYTPPEQQGMDPKLKTGLIIGGTGLAAALILVVALK